MKKILLVLGLVFFLMPEFVFAQVSQLCWTEKECEKFRKTFVDIAEVDKASSNPKCPADKGGFYAASCHSDAALKCGGAINANDEPLGFCLPAGKSVTKISFGGRNEFAHIGDFIQFIYKYGIMVAGVVAVIMVITGGAIWIFSGGSPDAITSAKKKIGGAVMGLILLALSYSILNLVNPYLVNMRLPEIWAINTVGLAAPTCGEIDNESTTFAEAFGQEKYKTITDKEKNELYGKVKFELTKKDTVCQKYFFTSDGKGQTCRGTVCADSTETARKICAPTPDLKKYNCIPGQLVMYFGVGSLWQDIIAGEPLAGAIFNTVENKTWWFDNDVFRYVGICQDSTGKRYRGGWEALDNPPKVTIQAVSVPSSFTPYIITLNNLVGPGSKSATELCEDHPNTTLVGLQIYGELTQDWDMDDGRYFIGQIGNSDTAAVGTWDQVGWNNFLSFDKLKNEGIFLKVIFDTNAISKILEVENSWIPLDSGTNTYTTKPASEVGKPGDD